MLIIIISLITLCLGLWLVESHDYGFLGAVLTVVCGTAFVSSVLILPINYYDNVSKIQEYYAFKQTVEEARSKNINELERATLINKIADMNMWLASVKYWNGTIFDIYIPDEVEELEMLK